jgi:spermine/spermidine synthase
MTNPEPPPLRAYVAVFLLCLASLSTEVTVTRLLSYKFFFHFVFLVISIAQLGLAAAAVWIFSRQRPAGLGFACRAAIAFGVSLCAFLVVYAAVPAPPPKLLNADALPYVLLCAAVLLVPYFAAGCALSAMFTSFKAEFHRLYAADLTGAALGCVACVALMMIAGPVKTVALTAGISLLAAAAFADDSWLARASLAAAIAVVLAGSFGSRFLGEGRRKPGPEFQWNHLARTDRRAPGFYVIDGDAATNIGEETSDVEYSLLPGNPSVAIIGPGAGPQLRVAMRSGVRAVFAVDINPTIIGWDQEIDAAVNGGIFNAPQVQVVVDEGRHALSARSDRFDLIVMHAIDTYTASSTGAYSLSENHLYTVEAFQAYFRHLSDEGLMSIRRWQFYPPRETLRLFTTALEGLAREGCPHPERQLVVISPTREYRDPDLQVWGYLFMFRKELGEERLAALDRFVDRANWAYLYRSGKAIDTPFTEYVGAADRGMFLEQFPYYVNPSYDANPFFFQVVRARDSFLSFFRSSRSHTNVIYSASTRVLYSTLIMLVVVTALMLWLPLRRYRVRHSLSPPPRWVTFYFASLGLGFMAVEMASLQIFSLFLGHPIYALSVILLGMLAFAGLSSSVCARIAGRFGPAVSFVVALLSGISAYGLLPAAHRFIGFPFSAKIALTLVYLAVIGVPLGMPMAMGIRRIPAARPFDVAWAWACNGAAGVVGTNICMILMIYFGTAASLAVAVGAYLVASITLSLVSRQATQVATT